MIHTHTIARSTYGTALKNMVVSDIYPHSDLLDGLRKGDRRAFERIYNDMADRLMRYVYARISSREASEDIVHEIFVSLWARRRDLQLEATLESWLFSAAKFQVLKYIRSKNVRRKYAADLVSFVATRYENNPEKLMELADLRKLIESSLSELPERCQKAFRMSRYEHRSIQDIAEEMGISTRTVENYITKALKHLRGSVHAYLWMVIIGRLLN